MSTKKKVEKTISLQIPGGKANPAPPIGPALGAAKVNIMAFCKEFNARTQNQAGEILPVVIYVYADKTFSFVTKQPPVPQLILKELKLDKGSPIPNRNKIGKLTKKQVKDIANRKRPDLIAYSEEAMFQLIAGTARSMGVEIE